MNEPYREELMDIYKNPAHFGTLTGATVAVSQNNPFCGDNMSLALKIEGGVIKEAKYTGQMCAVSIISSEMFLDFLQGKTVDEAKKLTKDDLLRLINLNLSTSRIACATLVYSALQKAL